MNPVADLLSRIGVTDAESLAEVSGLPIRDVQEIYSKAFAPICQAMLSAGLRISVRPAPEQLVIEIDTPAIDARNWDNLYRRSVGLLDFPSTYRDLRQTIRRIKTAKGPLSVVKTLTESIVPTPFGQEAWTDKLLEDIDVRAIGGRLVAHEDDKVPILAGPRERREWRRFATERLIADLVPFDAGAQLRWSLEARQNDAVTRITSGNVPLLIYKTILKSIEQQTDLAGRWRQLKIGTATEHSTS